MENVRSAKVLDGIEEQDWPRIDQIVIEIHDATGKAAGRIQDLLAAKGVPLRGRTAE